MNTKQKIINQAIALYNEHGLRNITSRDIAKSLGMSHGNLEYHFPTKEDLLMGIYGEMRNEISKVYEIEDATKDPMIQFNELLLQLETFQTKYLFFNLDVLEISRNFPNLNTLLKATLRVRREQMTDFYERFNAFGYLKKESLPGSYLRLQHSIRILITFWNSQQEIFPKFATEEEPKLTTYVWELVWPHLTKQGKITYNKL
ncbi:TetR/AcrR family transcriptional regulator [Aestuariibaculum suncheonense]|uniref:TetR/AcrR family transcriptional regulator n=1 Tax=Aestuariibaculum suncheonense TaxID=1028745 RepID=A0A8J6UL89_9FLAO|nr:TetR/AcrR family transcriptional regulator [Aestuariibaculum suncheonense]MBD0836206.1 TetR/AcrR family transcriptional regulator [Aestuariibaculum suncheonense]